MKKAKGKAKPALKAKRDSYIVQRANELSEQLALATAAHAVMEVGQLHPGMIPPVLVEIGLNLIGEGLSLYDQLPANVLNPNVSKGAARKLLVERALEQIRLRAADVGVAVSYRADVSE